MHSPLIYKNQYFCPSPPSARLHHPSILLNFLLKVPITNLHSHEILVVIEGNDMGVSVMTSIINISSLNNFYHSNYQIMMDFLILFFFAYLIFRIVSRFFTNIEQLFQSPPTKEPEAAPVLIPPLSNVRPSAPSNYKPPAVPSKPVASRDSNKPSASEKVGKIQAIPSQNSEKEELAKRKAAIQRQDIDMLRAELAESLGQNERLKEQIEGHKKEKAGYVARIEEIIQHVINNQAPVHQIQAGQGQSDEELKVLGELTKEIDHVHEKEVQKMKKREQDLIERVATEKEALQRDYLSQIDHITLQLKTKIDELNDLKLKNQKYEQDRIELDRNLEVFQESREGLEEELHLAQQEAEELRAQLAGTGVVQQNMTGQSEALRAQRAQCGRLKRQLQDLYGVQQEAKDLTEKLNHLREESNISHNDRLQADIQLNAQVQSLEKQKAEMQAQISQLSESLFRQEQERTQVINSAKAELTSKYETELQILIKNLEKEQEGRKQAQAKLSQVQSELQFVQAQLKATLESQKRLSAQIETLRSAKKVSVSDVQTHAEYLKLKRKVEELETQINNTHTQHSEEVKEVSPDRRINYARTKVERQASPTFQFENKGTPPSNSSRRGQVVSTIFAGGFEKTSPSSVQRYQTPLQKPVAQSSILQGGLLSEGFLGETNILGQKQREFLIGQIKTLKKIDVKKARLLYRSLASNPRPIAQYTSNVPNVLVVVQLSNKKLLGAFTQAAFTREMGQPQRKYSPANKAMIIDISEERIALNTSASDTIRYDEQALIWGRNEFVVSSVEPLLLSCDLNCQQAVYPCNFSSQELLGAVGRNCPISQFEVYRIFLG